jgi:hypothetical protein
MRTIASFELVRNSKLQVVCKEGQEAGHTILSAGRKESKHFDSVTPFAGIKESIDVKVVREQG